MATSPPLLFYQYKTNLDRHPCLHSGPSLAGKKLAKNSSSFAVKLIAIGVVGLLSLGMAEGALRLKNSSVLNYDIEMWRYSKELKVLSDNPVLGHEHVPNEAALLQGVEIRTNAYGLRGGPITPNVTRRILVLGSSITLGWGVEESDTMTALLEKRFDESGAADTQVLNAGIGNYNTTRYVERFLTNLTELQPTDIVVHYFLNDAEILPPPSGNWLMRNSQLAVTTWIMISRALSSDSRSLEDHYKSVYQSDSEGYKQMVASLQRLRDYCTANSIRLYLAVVPDIHNLSPYPFGFIHEKMRMLADHLSMDYIDFLNVMSEVDAESLWAMPGDPHPNALGHALMAQELFPRLVEQQ